MKNINETKRWWLIFPKKIYLNDHCCICSQLFWNLRLIAIESLINVFNWDYLVCWIDYCIFCFMSNKLYIHNKYIKGVGVSTSFIITYQLVIYNFISIILIQLYSFICRFFFKKHLFIVCFLVICNLCWDFSWILVDVKSNPKKFLQIKVIASIFHVWIGFETALHWDFI